MQNLISQISNYHPSNRREFSDRNLILHCLNTFSDVLTRENPICHLTASSWVVNYNHTKALMLFHNIMQTWMWPGGHADGEENLAEVALREVQEETNLTSARLLENTIFSLEVFSVPPHFRHSSYISSHLHLNCSFLLEADENEVFKVKPDENSAIRWIPFIEIEKSIREKTMEDHYQKLINKTRAISSPYQKH